jgi:hypothetical protein
MSKSMVLLCLILSGVAAADDASKHVRTSLRVTLEATADGVSGGHQGVSKRIVIPDGCDYVTHDVELLDGTSAHSQDGGITSFKDDVVRDRADRVTELRLTVGARRGDARRAPPETIKARMSVFMQCDAEIAERIEEGSGKGD